MPRQLKIALISNDIVGKSMAGPGIRYWEMAKALSTDFKVSVFVPNSCDIEDKAFEILAYDSKKSSKSIASQLAGFDWVICQSLRPPLIRKIKKMGIRFIADLYDPLTIEVLEYTKFDKKNIQKNDFDFNQAILRLQLSCADHILCASERQKDFYLGILSDMKQINPKSYAENPDFENFITLAPFGLEEKDISKIKSNLMSEKFPSIKPSDKIIYWGGGIWDWFDPLSVVKAVESISKERNDIKLFFLGVKHPNPKIKAMEMANKTVTYCKGKDLIDKFVFFNFGWTPYEERLEYISHAMIGVTTHNNNLETRFSFRTRVLDYLMAELPIISTTGDSMADLIEKQGLGITVPYNDPESIKKAILQLVDDNEFYGSAKKNISEIKSQFYWSNICKGFAEKILSDKIEFRKVPFIKFLNLTSKFYFAGFKKKFFK